MTKYLSSVQVLAATGATYRQLDWWIRQGIIKTIGPASPGSGFQRKFEREVVPKIRRLVMVSTLTFNRGTNGIPKNLANFIYSLDPSKPTYIFKSGNKWNCTPIQPNRVCIYIPDTTKGPPYFLIEE